MHVMVVTNSEPKKGYVNFTLGNLWATQPIALLIWPPLLWQKTLFLTNLKDTHTVVCLTGVVCRLPVKRMIKLLCTHLTQKITVKKV